jgi:phage repressor protein C with HTH and peptisase S24 domain
MTGKDLAKYRRDAQLTQGEFAERLGLNRASLSRIESSQDPVSKSVMHKLSLAFKPVKQSERESYLINYYDIDATATPMEIFNDQSVIPSAQLDLPGFAGCDFAINVAGSSMYPSIENGAMILCKKVMDKSIILYGEVYFVVTNDYRMVKRLRKSPRKGYVVCSSDNHNGHDHPDGKTYADIDIPIDKIVHLYLVKGSIKRHQI